MATATKTSRRSLASPEVKAAAAQAVQAEGVYHMEYFRSNAAHAKKQPWYWRMREQNTQVVAAGIEGYSSRTAIEKRIGKLCDGLGLKILVVEVDYETAAVKKVLREAKA